MFCVVHNRDVRKAQMRLPLGDESYDVKAVRSWISQCFAGYRESYSRYWMARCILQGQWNGEHIEWNEWNEWNKWNERKIRKKGLRDSKSVWRQSQSAYDDAQRQSGVAFEVGKWSQLRVLECLTGGWGESQSIFGDYFGYVCALCGGRVQQVKGTY